MFQLFRTYVAIVFIWMFLKVDRRYCVCCNMSHLSQLPAVAARVPCMEGSVAVGMEGRGKQGSMGEWRG
jgi:hypothetical protein